MNMCGDGAVDDEGRVLREILAATGPLEEDRLYALWSLVRTREIVAGDAARAEVEELRERETRYEVTLRDCELSMRAIVALDHREDVRRAAGIVLKCIEAALTPKEPHART